MSTSQKIKRQLLQEFFNSLEQSSDKDKIIKENQDEFLALLEDYVFSNDK